MRAVDGWPDLPLLLGRPPISHEYYDPAEFMEGGPQEADRTDELEYEVSWAARPRAGSAASLRSQRWDGCLQPSSGLGPAVPRQPGLMDLPGAWLLSQAHVPSWAESGRARVRSCGQSVLVSLCAMHVCVVYIPCVLCVSWAFLVGETTGHMCHLGW